MTSQPLKLYHYWRSTSSWRVRWALAHKGIECEYIPVHLLTGESESPEHLKRNPLGYVPVLEIPHPSPATPGATRSLTESLAIIEWLEETFPRPSLLPKDPYLRARTRALAEVINSDTQPLQNLNTQELHSSDPLERKKWTQYWIRNGLAAYEILVRETAGIFSVGNEITTADLCLIPQCYAAARNEIGLEDYPTIARIREAAIKTEAYRLSEPERFKPKDA